MILSRQHSFLLAATALVIISLTFAIVSWTRTTVLYLPLPTYLSVVNVLFTILTLIAFPVSLRLDSALKKKMLKTISPYIISVSNLALFTFFILSLVYAIPSDMQSCTAERQWLRMFMNKNDIAIRRIQSRLRCCGYNSMHDRAWPFPGNGLDARVCERTQGYFIACGGLWRQEQQAAAALTAGASFLNWILVMLLSNYPSANGQIQLIGGESRLEAAGEGQMGRPKLRPARFTNGNTSVDNHRDHSQPGVEGLHNRTGTTDQSVDSNAAMGSIPESPPTGESRHPSTNTTQRPVESDHSHTPKGKDALPKAGLFNAGAKDFIPIHPSS